MSCAVASIYTMPNAIAQSDNTCFKAVACGGSDDRRETIDTPNWVRFEKLANLDLLAGLMPNPLGQSGAGKHRRTYYYSFRWSIGLQASAAVL